MQPDAHDATATGTGHTNCVVVPARRTSTATTSGVFNASSSNSIFAASTATAFTTSSSFIVSEVLLTGTSSSAARIQFPGSFAELASGSSLSSTPGRTSCTTVSTVRTPGATSNFICGVGGHYALTTAAGTATAAAVSSAIASFGRIAKSRSLTPLIPWDYSNVGVVPSNACSTSANYDEILDTSRQKRFCNRSCASSTSTAATNNGNIVFVGEFTHTAASTSSYKEGINVRVLCDFQHTAGQQLHHAIIKAFVVRPGVLKL